MRPRWPDVLLPALRLVDHDLGELIHVDGGYHAMGTDIR
jgi:hypothetical protein